MRHAASQRAHSSASDARHLRPPGAAACAIAHSRTRSRSSSRASLNVASRRSSVRGSRCVSRRSRISEAQSNAGSPISGLGSIGELPARTREEVAPVRGPGGRPRAAPGVAASSGSALTAPLDHGARRRGRPWVSRPWRYRARSADGGVARACRSRTAGAGLACSRASTSAAASGGGLVALRPRLRAGLGSARYSSARRESSRASSADGAVTVPVGERVGFAC